MCVRSIRAYNPNAKFCGAPTQIERRRAKLSLFGQFSLLRTATFLPVWCGEGRPLAEPNGCHPHLPLLKLRHPYPLFHSEVNPPLFYFAQL